VIPARQWKAAKVASALEKERGKGDERASSEELSWMEDAFFPLAFW